MLTGLPGSHIVRPALGAFPFEVASEWANEYVSLMGRPSRTSWWQLILSHASCASLSASSLPLMPMWGLYFDDLHILAPPEAFSHDLYGSIKDAQVLGLPVQA